MVDKVPTARYSFAKTYVSGDYVAEEGTDEQLQHSQLVDTNRLPRLVRQH